MMSSMRIFESLLFLCVKDAFQVYMLVMLRLFVSESEPYAFREG